MFTLILRSYSGALAPSRFSDHIHQIAEDFLEGGGFSWVLEDG